MITWKKHCLAWGNRDPVAAVRGGGKPVPFDGNRRLTDCFGIFWPDILWCHGTRLFYFQTVDGGRLDPSATADGKRTGVFGKCAHSETDQARPREAAETAGRRREWGGVNKCLI